MSEKSPEQVLKQVFGHESFRADQEKVVRRALEGQNSLVLMPTGMGKSLCYQIPAVIFEGLTVVISPLIALMKDQVDTALKKGLRCCYINSSLSRGERENRYRRLKKGEYELLYVTPERFRKEEFLQALRHNKISLLAVDEAHCISQWGHDFRPDYTRIKDFRELLGEPPTMALTATATPDVQKDIVRQLGLTENQIRIFNSGMQRPNLRVHFQEIVGLDQKIQYFIVHRHQVPGSTILYFSLIETLEKFSYELSRLGVEHGTYHGRMPPQKRRWMQERFVDSENGLILATPAFGLGIDKENVRSVVHAEMPGSIESYYQEIGRAGRDGNPADCVLLFDADDISIQMDFLKWANPDPGFIRTVYRLIKNNTARVKSEGLDYLRQQMNFYNSRDFRLETALNLLERWDCLAGQLARGDFVVGEEPPEEFLSQNQYDQRLKSQQKKLLDMVQLVREFAGESADPKEKIYAYFGLESNEPTEKDGV